MSADKVVALVQRPAAEENPAAGQTCGRPECGAAAEFVCGKYFACQAHAEELTDLVCKVLSQQENELIRREMRGEFLEPEVTPNWHHVYRSRGTMMPARTP